MPSPNQFIALKTVVSQLVNPPELEWQNFTQLFQQKSLRKQEFFIQAGSTSIDLGFINSGLVCFFYENEHGIEFNKTFCQENQWIAAYSAYLTNTPARFNIQALENTHILTAKLADIVLLFDQHECWQKLGRLLAEQLYIKKEQREAEFLLDSALQRYKNFLHNHPQLEQRLPQYHIASYLGITAVALSRIKNKLKK